jgi:hypothetical protein
LARKTVFQRWYVRSSVARGDEHRERALRAEQVRSFRPVRVRADLEPDRHPVGVGRTRRIGPGLVVARLPEPRLLGKVQLFVRRDDLARGVECEGTAGPAAVVGAMDDAAHETDAGLGGRLGLRASPLPVHRLGVRLDRVLRARPPLVQRQLREHGDVGAALGRLGQTLAQAGDAIRLPVRLGDERDGQATVLAADRGHSARNSRSRFWK